MGVGLLLLTVATKWRQPPSKADHTPATTTLPSPHLIKGKDDGDASIALFDAHRQPAGHLLLDDGWVYGPNDGSVYPVITHHYYAIDATRWDVGAVCAYREGGRGTDGGAIAGGLRVSPVRLLWGTVAPDIVVTEDWAGAGASAYLPRQIVGNAASHFGIGAWYGVPYGSSDRDGPAGWCFGLSFSIR